MPNTSATGGFLEPGPGPILEDAALVAVFQKVLVGITGLDGSLVRPRWQTKTPKQPDPSVDWCAVGVGDEIPDAGPSIVHDGAAAGGLGQDNLQRHIDFDVHVTFYGPNSGGYAARLRDGLCILQNDDLLKMNLIAFVSSGTIARVPELVSEQWVDRRDITLRFRRQVVRTYAIENILSAGVSLAFY